MTFDVTQCELKIEAVEVDRLGEWCWRRVTLRFGALLGCLAIGSSWS